MIRIFGQRREEPSLLEAHASAVTFMEEQPPPSAIEAASTLEEETLAATQDSSKSLQGMHEFASIMEDCTLLHVDCLEEGTFTVLCHYA